MNKKKLIRDKVIIFIWPIVACIFSFILKANFFFSMLLFMIFPSIYLSMRDKGLVKKAIIFSLPALIIAIPVDYIAHLTGTWYVPTSIIGIKLFGIVSLEVLLWIFFFAYFPILYYEYFLDHKFKDRTYYPREKYVYAYFGLVLISFLIILALHPTWLKIRYFYLYLGTILILIPVISAALKFPNLITKFLKTSVYFFFVYILQIITAVSLNHWNYPGKDFIGFVTLFNVTFPFEELFFWIILGTFAVLSYYEFFDENRK